MKSIIALIITVVTSVSSSSSSPVPTDSVPVNKYNEMGYTDITGRTVGDVAAEIGMELDEFLELYWLPEDMPADTNENAAYNNIPLAKMAEEHGMSVDEIKELLQMPDDVTDYMPWGEALDKVTLGAYVGEDYLDEFKEYYGFGDDVTAQTLWGEVRQRAEAVDREMADEEQQGSGLFR